MSSPSSPEPRGVALLGSTGSIGRQAVEVLAAHPELFRVVALATGSNADVLQVPGNHYAPFLDAHEQVVEAELAFLQKHLIPRPAPTSPAA